MHVILCHYVFSCVLSLQLLSDPCANKYNNGYRMPYKRRQPLKYIIRAVERMGIWDSSQYVKIPRTMANLSAMIYILI